MLFQVLCGFEPIFYTTHPNEEPFIIGFSIGFIYFDNQDHQFPFYTDLPLTEL